MTKITIPVSCVLGLVPGAENLGKFPRKKKKLIKKQLAKIVSKLLKSYMDDETRDSI